MVVRVMVAVGLLSLSACASSNDLNVLAAALGGAASAAPANPPPSEGLYYRREFVSGQNKVCVYHGVTGDQYVTTGIAELCPLTR